MKIFDASAEEVGNPFHLATACFGLGSMYLRKGDLPDAIAQLGRALALIEAHSIDVFLPGTSAYLGLALAWSGQVTEGSALLERALHRSRFMNISAGWARLTTYRGEAHLLAGHVAEARQWAEAALQHAQARGERGNEALAARLLGDVTAREGVAGPRLAEPLYQRALARAHELQMRPLAALCHLSLGRVLQERSDAQQAAMHLGRAAEMLEQMDMGFWVRSAADHLSLVREPAT